MEHGRRGAFPTHSIMSRRQPPAVTFARNLSWLVRHINGETLKKIADTTEHDPGTVAKGVNKASEALVEYAQSKLMADVFPLVTELYRAAVMKEIEKVKEGKELDWKLVDKLLKGLSIVDRPQPIASPLPTQPNNGVEGFDTLTGFIAQRTPPPRIGDKSNAPAKQITASEDEAIDVEPIIEGDTK